MCKDTQGSPLADRLADSYPQLRSLLSQSPPTRCHTSPTRAQDPVRYTRTIRTHAVTRRTVSTRHIYALSRSLTRRYTQPTHYTADRVTRAPRCRDTHHHAYLPDFHPRPSIIEVRYGLLEAV